MSMRRNAEDCFRNQGMPLLIVAARSAAGEQLHRIGMSLESRISVDEGIPRLLTTSSTRMRALTPRSYQEELRGP